MRADCEQLGRAVSGSPKLLVIRAAENEEVSHMIGEDMRRSSTGSRLSPRSVTSAGRMYSRNVKYPRGLISEIVIYFGARRDAMRAAARVSRLVTRHEGPALIGPRKGRKSRQVAPRSRVPSQAIETIVRPVAFRPLPD